MFKEWFQKNNGDVFAVLFAIVLLLMIMAPVLGMK